MSRLRSFWVWPNGGAAQETWDKGPALDAFARSSRRVCELVEECLASRSVEAPHGEVRLFLGASGDERVVVEVAGGHVAGFDGARVLLPDAVAGLSAQGRGLLVLEVVERVLETLARMRGWGNADQLAGIGDEVRAKQLRYVRIGPWKSSPDRRLRARPVAEIADDGLSRLHYDISDAKSDELLGVTRSTWVRENRRTALNGLFAENRWQGTSGVAMRRTEFLGEGVWREASGVFEVDQLSTGPVSVNPEEPAQLNPLEGVIPAACGLEVEVVTWWGEGTDQAKVISGGFTDAAPGDHREFRAAYFAYMAWIRQYCVDWWSAAEPNVLHLYLETSDYHRTGRLVRLNGDEVTATARRRPEDLLGDVPDRDLARVDLAALLQRTATRLHLLAPPELPDADALGAQIAANVAAQSEARDDEEWWLDHGGDQLPDVEW